MPNKKVLYLLKMKNKAVENPNDQAQISNKTPNPKPKNYNSAKRTLKYFLFGILLEIGIYHRHGRDPAHINNNKVAGEFWILRFIFDYLLNVLDSIFYNCQTIKARQVFFYFNFGPSKLALGELFYFSCLARVYFAEKRDGGRL